jgi:predicted phosphoadenosine phosphosulfate sulfurtransferase
MNFFLFNAAHFGKYKHLYQLLTEATFLDINIEINTYMKILCTLFIDYEIDYDKGETIEYITTLLKNDHTELNYMLVTNLLEHYLIGN